MVFSFCRRHLFEIRYINTDIYENLEGVIEQIGKTIQKIEEGKVKK